MNGTTDDADKFVSSSYICRPRLFHSARKFCNDCRHSENVGKAVSKTHDSAPFARHQMLSASEKDKQFILHFLES